VTERLDEAGGRVHSADLPGIAERHGLIAD